MKKYWTLTILTALFAWWMLPRYKNNVCKTFEDYYTNRDLNENCYHNPDTDLTVPKIVERNGYPIETHEVVTSDRYVLTVFRIPHGKKSRKIGKPVLLHHGTHSNCVVFVNLGEKSLAYTLADQGYDVWLANIRGTEYSSKHLDLNHTTDQEYWNFSFHEHGAYDLKVQIDLVLGKTGQKINYIGYSIGTTIMYIYSCLYPEISKESINTFINIAPAAFVGGEIFTATKFLSIIWDYVEGFMRYLTEGRIDSPYMVPAGVVRHVCGPYPFQMEICRNLLKLVMGSSDLHQDPETLPITLIKTVDRTSLKLWTHMSQLWHKGTFEQYDYGREANIELYGTAAPPKYNLSKVEVPLYIIRARDDWLLSEIDANRLYEALPKHNKPKSIYVVEEYGHFDLLVAKNVVPVVHRHILDILKSVT